MPHVTLLRSWGPFEGGHSTVVILEQRTHVHVRTPSNGTCAPENEVTFMYDATSGRCSVTCLICTPLAVNYLAVPLLRRAGALVTKLKTCDLF